MKLSKNFQLQEFYVSSSFPELAKKMVPNATDKLKLAYLARTILQPVREYIGYPLKITSGKRSRILNQKIGGSPTSDHMFEYDSCCCDFRVISSPDWTEQAALFIHQRLPYSYGQLILYFNDDGQPRHVHVSLPSFKNHQEAMIKYPGQPFELFQTKYPDPEERLVLV